jgi:hypothetical protein
MNITYTLLLFILPVILSGAIALLLRNNHIKVNIHRKYFTVKVINGIALILSIYNLGFTFFWLSIHREPLSFFNITTLTKMTTLFYYFLLPVDLIIFVYVILNLKQKKIFL